ncbi:hypothetical protein CALCODRAFT_491561 [Calocera cornea HHB12733]|uniref:Serine-type endopeptidase n=1 Tax=Calocera cornea HHB12733 TaxID=1353952 RepID=A0A165IZ78_9BASI|nr:hypothetical protein CALCODRAFT_491561 [Calocera cornea HHB12733]
MLSSILLAALALTSVTLASPLSTGHHPDAPSQASLAFAPLMADPPQPIQDSYIVVFKKEASVDQITSHLSLLQQFTSRNPLTAEDEGGIQHFWDGSAGVKGYAGRFSEATLDSIRMQPEIDYVEKDQVVHTQGDVVKERNAPWGLARISHRPALRLSTFKEYIYDEDGGAGVDVYVIDTGVRIDHVEFEGRAKWGQTFVDDGDYDGNGHGTHCSGTIASRTYGVAKSANIIAVKVLGANGSGSMSGVVSGVNWAASQASKKLAEAKAELIKTGSTKHKGSVANMSLGGGKSKVLDAAVNGAVEAGMHFAVAAGNDNKDACDYSPAAAELAVTVGASTLADQRAYFSNFGKCVDVFAPGLNILSTWATSNISTNTISGTSMASPHTAGLLAYLLSIYPSSSFDPVIGDHVPKALVSVTSKHTTISYLTSILGRFLPFPLLPVEQLLDPQSAPVPTLITPAQLKKALIKLSTDGVLTDLPAGTVNKLIYNNATIAK